MNTIAITFPQVKINLDIKQITFDTLENTVFDVTQEIGRKVIEKTLFDIDNKLREERPKKALENTGRKEKFFLTRLGDIRYKRTRYKDKATNKPRYLLEEKLNMQKNQRISLSRAKIEMFLASFLPYRRAKKTVELLTGVKRSHESMRQSVIKEAERLLSYEKHSIEKTRRLEDPQKETASSPDIAYIEADATYIRLQRRRKRKGTTNRLRRRRRRSIEIKFGIGYTGRENRYRTGFYHAKRLKDKFTYLTIASGRKFMEDLSLVAEKRLSLSEKRRVFFGGDGDMWITRGIKDFFPGAIYLLCLFHLFRNLRRALSYRKDMQEAVKKLIVKDRIDDCLKLIQKMIKYPKDKKEKESLKEFYHYIQQNREGISATRQTYDKEIKARLKRTGAVEPNIDKTIAHRFKKRGMSWSTRGALSLLKIKETIANNEWDSWWEGRRDEKIQINLEPLHQLTAKDFWKKEGNKPPLLEMNLPALHGPDRNEPWAKAIRELQTIDYYK